MATIYNTDNLVSEPREERSFPARTPIAIVGMGCRFPGGADTLERFWTLLRDGVDAIGEIPPDRWLLSTFYHPDAGRAGRSYVRWGGFVKDIDKFDAEFFGISPREAARMDPQHRMLLEVAFEALEDAGQAAERLAGTKTGVFIGISTCDYGGIQLSVTERRSIDAYTNLGMGLCIAANRISYLFDLHGPSMAVDTACSSSLVAVHLACQSIWSGESEQVLTGGVNAILRPEGTIGFSKASMLSPNGRCKSFDIDANGYVRSEGAGMMLLKPLAKALADRDSIYAVIRGTAVNEDGRTPGIALPSGTAQEAMLRDAYRRAGISPSHVQYVEAHGTGTLVGDPIELIALGNAVGRDRAPDDYCLVGSVKSNIGHLEAASGVAGLIKAALCLKHGQIPPSVHFQTPNPKIPFEELRLRVPTALQPWPTNGGGPKIAGVNSFGFGGANAHVVLEEAPAVEPAPAPATATEDRAVLVPLSARGPEALKALAQTYSDFLKDERSSGASLRDICYTASLRRGHHDHRLAMAVHSREELAEHLEAFVAGETRLSMHSGRQASGHNQKLVFVFSGMGPQWWGMGRQLLVQEPVFRDVIDRCDQLLRQHTDWSLREELTADEERSRISETHIAQPSIFALQAGLAALLRSWGIEPAAIVGHSVGEVAAAYVAGVLDLEDAIRLIFHRSRLQRRIAGQGAMLAVGTNEEEAEAILSGYEGRVTLAAINSPTDVTLSGDTDALQEIAKSLDEKQLFQRFLQVEVPYHSPRMESLKEELLESLEGLRPHQAAIPLFSTATASMVEGPEMDGGYWFKNIKSPVRFATAIRELARTGHNIFYELSPHPVLARAISECLAEAKKDGVVVASLRRGEPEQAMMLASLGRLYTQGCPVDWGRHFPEGGRFVKLPHYPWQRERYWCETETTRRERLGFKQHPLLATQLESARPAWGGELDLQALGFLEDHRVQDTVVFPAAAFVEMALACARDSLGGGPAVVEDLIFHRALVLSRQEPVTVQFVRDPAQSSFEVHSRTGGDGANWVLNASGKLRRLQDARIPQQVALDEILSRCSVEIPKQLFYQQFHDIGLQYGPRFQGVERLWVGREEAVGQIEADPSVAAELDDYLLHPAILDASFQVLMGAIIATVLKQLEAGQESKGLYLPVNIEKIRVYGRSGAKVRSYARLTERTATSIKGDIQLFSDDGRVVADVQGFRCRLIEQGSETIDNYLYEHRWLLKARFGQAFSSRAADHFPSPQQIAERLEPEAKRLGVEFGPNRFRDSRHLTDVLTNAYVLEAFQKLGCHVSVGQRLSVDSLIDNFGVAPNHRRLLERIFTLWEEDGALEKAGDHWEVKALPQAGDSEQLWRSLWDLGPAFMAELMLLRRCGERFDEALRGEVDPLQLIFPDGSLNMAEHLYQDAPANRIYNMLVQKSVTAALERLPEGQTVRILEVGGGTGGMTTFVLRKLPPARTEYVFTDVTQMFSAHAEQKFHEYPFVRYQVLDIESDPLAQGFEAHSFDMILASDVLHATRNLQHTLDNVKQLLASNGLLILLEGTAFPRWTMLVFGLLKGWWLFSDVEVRGGDPWISQSAWRRVLADAGFTETAVLSDVREERDAFHSVILARGPSVQQDAEPAQPRSDEQAAAGAWLIFADSRGVGQELAGRVKQQGYTPILVTPGEAYGSIAPDHFEIRPDQPEDIRHVLETALATPSGCRRIVHLWSLDAAPPSETMPDSLRPTQKLGCVNVLRVVQELLKLAPENMPGLRLVTSGVHKALASDAAISVSQSPLWGLARVITTEQPALNCKIIDLSPNCSREEVQSLAADLLADERDDEVALRGGARFVHRLVRTSLVDILRRSDVRAPSGGKQPFCLEITTPGVLDNLTWKAIDRRPPTAGEVEIEVYAAALNFKDIMVAMGLLPEEALEGGYTGRALGMECSGRIVAVGEGVKTFKPGDEVITSCAGALRTYVTVDGSFVVPKPAAISFEEAATIPVAFITAYYALHHIGRMKKGDRVLIHAAAGGVGLAAIQLAQKAGAEVFATAGSDTKRGLLRALGVRHVMDSRSLAFADEIMELTKGKGVDIVLNSLAGEAIPKSLSVLGSYGRFVEIGKRDIYENRRIEMGPFRKNLSLSAVDLDKLCVDRPDVMKSLMWDVMGGFTDNSLRPLPHRVFPISEAANAFRHVAQAKHIGKVVVSLQDADVRVDAAPPPQLTVAEDGTYLVTGGLGGFGFATAQWLAGRGARHLILMSRRDAPSPEMEAELARLRDSGVQVVVARADVARRDDVARVLEEARQSMPPLRGIMHAAMVLDDGLLPQLDEDRIWKVMDPKATGAWNLHTLTLNDPLDFFVMFSSFSASLGTPGQGNYVAANMFLEALALHRRTHGLPGMAVGWGVVGDVGYVARTPDVIEKFEQLGARPLPSELLLETLGKLLQRGAVQTAICWQDWQRMCKLVGFSPRYDTLLAGTASDESEGAGTHLLDALMAVAPEERQPFLESHIREQLAKVLGTSPSKVDVEKPLLDLGLDSLMALEIANRIQADLGVKIPPMKFMEGLTVAGLATTVIEQLTETKPAPAAAPTAQQETSRELLEKVDQLSDEEVDTLLQELTEEEVAGQAGQKVQGAGI